MSERSGLRRKIWVAFILQAAAISFAAVLGVYGASAVLKHVDESVRRHEAREQLLARLLRLRLRCLAYKHVSPLRIYSQKDAPA